VVAVADRPLDPVGEVVSLLMDRSVLWVVSVRVSLFQGCRCQDGGLGLGGVGHWVAEPGRRPEVVVGEGLGDDVSRCAARRQLLGVLGEAALSWMLPLRWSLSPP
jgi:hypothetical protein